MHIAVLVLISVSLFWLSSALLAATCMQCLTQYWGPAVNGSLRDNFSAHLQGSINTSILV